MEYPDSNVQDLFRPSLKGEGPCHAYCQNGSYLICFTYLLNLFICHLFVNAQYKIFYPNAKPLSQTFLFSNFCKVFFYQTCDAFAAGASQVSKNPCRIIQSKDIEFIYGFLFGKDMGNQELFITPIKTKQTCSRYRFLPTL